MKLLVQKGRTSLLVKIFIPDSASTTGGGKTGLAFNTSSLVCYRARDDDGNAGATAITLATATKGTWTSGGFVEKDATNMPGIYEFGIPNNAIASGSETCVIMLKGASGMTPVILEIQLVAYDPQDAVRQGMTSLPNAAAEAAGGLYTRGSGAGQINQDANGRVDINAVAWKGTTLAAADTAGYPKVTIKSGTGTGEINLASGVADSNVVNWKGSTAPAMTGDAYARLGAPAGASVSADVAAVKSDSGAVKTQTDKLTFTVANQIDANVLDWKSATAPAMTGDAYARLGAPAGASVSADVAAIKTETAAIKAKTDSLTFTVTAKLDVNVYTWNGTAVATPDTAGYPKVTHKSGTGTGELNIASGVVDGNVVNWKGSTAPAMTGDAYARLGAPAGASVSADVAAVKTDTAAIKAKTDNLPSDPADASDISGSFSSIASTLSTIAGYIDTEVAAIKAKTDNLPATPAAAGDAMALTGGAVDAILDEVIEGAITLRQTARLINALALGDATGLNSTPTYLDPGGTKTRIASTLSDGGETRTIDSSDLT